MDRLSAMARKKPMLTIPVLDVQKQLDDNYRDQIELFSCRVADLEDTNKILQDINERLRQRDSDSQVRALVAQQDAFITEAKKQIEQYKIKRDAELKSKTSEAEHLAKQAIRLNEENSKLLKENVELAASSNQLNGQTPLLMAENQKYREQTTRFIEEKRKLEEQMASLDDRWEEKRKLEEQMASLDDRWEQRTKELFFEKNIASYKDIASKVTARPQGDTSKTLPRHP
jgi:DNA repair ATPase RecN